MSMEIQPNAESENIARSMPEMGFIIAFCEKFKPLFKGFEFWPEELEGALATEADSDLIDQVHCIFLTNCLNRTKPVSRQSWRKLLSETIDQKLKKSYQFYRDYNPLRRVKNYYELDIKDKVLILNNLVTWQLQEGKEVRKLIEQEYRSSKRNEVNSLEVEPYGEDKKGRKFYYFGYGARVYRETIIPHKGSKSKKYIWEVISTTLEDLENYINDPKELKSSSGKDKAFYNKVTKELVPAIKQSIEAKERREARKLRQEKLAQRVALLHANSEVIASRTRSGTRRAMGLEPDKKSASTLSSTSYTKSRYDEAYNYSAGPHMTRAKAARESAKRKYIDYDDDADSQDSLGRQSTRSAQSSLASQVARISTNDYSQQTSDDLSSLSNGISTDFRIDGDEMIVSSQEKISEPMSRSVSNISQTSSTSKLSREIFGTDSITSVSEKAGDDDYKEVFGSDDGTELSEPEEVLGSESGSD